MSTTSNLDKRVSEQAREQAEAIMHTEISFTYADEFESLSLDEIEIRPDEEIYANGDGREDQVGIRGMESPLLTAHGEQLLFRLMNYCRYRANALRSKIHPKRASKSKISEIHVLLARAERARTEIVQANLRLVAAIARKYAKSKTENDEFISEGNMILLNAVDKFDYSRGFRFSTYATHAVQRHLHRQMQRKQRQRKREVGTPTDVLADIAPVPELDQPLDHKVAERIIKQFDSCLDKRESVIIKERFGLNGRPAQTLNSVAEKVHLSKERVRQLQMRALEKLQDLTIRMNIRLEPSF